MSIENTSSSEDHDIETMELDELREEADRLLTEYRLVKDPDELLSLSSRYSRVDMLIDQRESQSNMHPGDVEEVGDFKLNDDFGTPAESEADAPEISDDTGTFNDDVDVSQSIPGPLDSENNLPMEDGVQEPEDDPATEPLSIAEDVVPNEMPASIIEVIEPAEESESIAEDYAPIEESQSTIEAVEAIEAVANFDPVTDGFTPAEETQSTVEIIEPAEDDLNVPTEPDIDSPVEDTTQFEVTNPDVEARETAPAESDFTEDAANAADHDSRFDMPKTFEEMNYSDDDWTLADPGVTEIYTDEPVENLNDSSFDSAADPSVHEHSDSSESVPDKSEMRDSDMSIEDEALQLLEQYHGTKDPDEMLELSTRYAKLDIIIDERNAQQRDDHEASSFEDSPTETSSDFDSTFPNELVDSSLLNDEAQMLDTEIDDSDAIDDSGVDVAVDQVTENEEGTQVEEISGAVDAIETQAVDSENSDDDVEETLREISDVLEEPELSDASVDTGKDPESTPDNFPFDAPAFDLQFDEGLPNAGINTVTGETPAVSDSESDTEEARETSNDTVLGGIPAFADASDAHDPSTDTVAGDFPVFSNEAVPEPDADDTQNPIIETVADGFPAFPDEEPPEPNDELDAGDRQDEPSHESSPGDDESNVTDVQDDDHSDTVDEPETSAIETETSTFGDELPPLDNEPGFENFVEGTDDAASDEEADDESTPFENAFSSLTAALGDSPEPEQEPLSAELYETEPETNASDIEDDSEKESNSSANDAESSEEAFAIETQEFNSDDDLMDQLQTVNTEPTDDLFNIDVVEEGEASDDTDADANPVHILVEEGTSESESNGAADAIEETDHSDDEATHVLEDVGDNESTLVSDEVGDSDDETTVDPTASGADEEDTGSIGSLEDFPLPSIAPIEDSDVDTGATIPAIVSFESLNSQEDDDAHSAQEPALPLQDKIPSSISEELPKFTLNDKQRICSHCGEITTLSEETCKSCSYADASLGILNSVVAGDAQQAARLLNAKPAIIHTTTSSHGWTLLHMASSGGNARLVDLLLRRGSSVNAQNIYGKTALHYAATKGHIKIAKLLITNNADTDMLFEGKSALQHAIENNQHEVAEYLKAASA